MDSTIISQQPVEVSQNSTAFPDDFISNITVKDILVKWTDTILWQVKIALEEYYSKNSPDLGHKDFVQMCFQNTYCKIQHLSLILEDLVTENVRGIEDIFIAIYGIASDEVYVLRDFLRLYHQLPCWDETCMWNGGNSRISRILCMKKQR